MDYPLTKGARHRILSMHLIYVLILTVFWQDQMFFGRKYGNGIVSLQSKDNTFFRILFSFSPLHILAGIIVMPSCRFYTVLSYV